ncbi:probable pectate lyase 16 [Cornus florida]|uniref:probable pectate lyase 16 n=1 Tax=Cornus florida TaxID=4283 RepID=UPI0028989D53|nr:probable pectate lyase 16 [Cornus florida]
MTNQEKNLPKKETFAGTLIQTRGSSKRRELTLEIEFARHPVTKQKSDRKGKSSPEKANEARRRIQVTNVIIHGLVIHHIRPHTPGAVMGPGKKMGTMDRIDGDAIRLVTSSKVWIDHNTLFECEDGLIDVTRGSTGITISNNWFRNHKKVMLLGHHDGFLRNKDMKVTVVFNHFGPNCKQRMPRVRHGYAHVVDNLYQGWGLYAIGGSVNPSVKSEANLFIAPNSRNKEDMDCFQ